MQRKCKTNPRDNGNCLKWVMKGLSRERHGEHHPSLPISAAWSQVWQEVERVFIYWVWIMLQGRRLMSHEKNRKWPEVKRRCCWLVTLLVAMLKGHSLPSSSYLGTNSKLLVMEDKDPMTHPLPKALISPPTTAPLHPEVSSLKPPGHHLWFFLNPLLYYCPLKGIYFLLNTQLWHRTLG